MPLKGVFASVFLCWCALGVCRSTAFAFDPAQLPVVTVQMRGALTEIDSLLLANPTVAESWKAYLGLADIRQQLEAGPDADPDILAAIRRRTERAFSGSERAQVQSFTAALQKWEAILRRPSARELWQQAKEEADDFRPATLDEVERERQTCLLRLAALDQQLAREGANGVAWRKCLFVDEVLTAVRKSDWKMLPADVGQLWQAAIAIWPTDSLLAAHESLRQYEYTRIRHETQETAVKFHDRLLNLVEAYRLWRETPTAERQLALSTLVHELELRGQARQLTQVVRFEHSRPNFVVRVSAPFVAKQTQRPVADAFPVNDTIVGTPVSGTAAVQGEAFLKIVPSETAANLDIQFTGNMFSSTSAFSRGVQVDTEGTTRLIGRKRLFLDGLGLRTGGADVSANSAVELLGIYGGPLRRRIAHNQYYKQQGAAQAESEQKAAQQTEERLNEAVATFQKKLLTDAGESSLAPLFSNTNDLGKQWRTNSSAMEGRFWSADPHEFAATNVAPQIALGKGVSFQVHETFMERTMRERIGGKSIKSQEMADGLFDLFPKVDPKVPEPTPDDEWSITFAKNPIRVRFADDHAHLTMFIEKFESEKGDFPGIQVSAQYAVVCEPPSLSLRRVGDVEVLPIDFRADSSGGLSGRQQVLRRFIQRQFSNQLRGNIHLGSIPPSPKNGLKERLDFVESRTKEGWMSLLMEPPSAAKR